MHWLLNLAVVFRDRQRYFLIKIEVVIQFYSSGKAKFNTLMNEISDKSKNQTFLHTKLMRTNILMDNM